MTTHKPFREAIAPGTNFEFIGRARLWITISVLLSIGCVALLFVNKATRGDYMNWTIDFKGGTEVVVDFRKSDTHQYAEVDPGRVRKALKDAGFESFEVSELTFADSDAGEGSGAKVHGLLIRSLDFGALPADKQAKYAKEFVDAFKGDAQLDASWSGDMLIVRGTTLVSHDQAREFFAKRGLELRPWNREQQEQYSVPIAGTGEYTAQYAIRGIDAQYQKALVAGLKGYDTSVINVYSVGAKAGAKLRHDGIKSTLFALLLVMLYLAVRFDIRYAPGALVATLHDVIMVVGWFALTWQEVSLTTVAALLTVIGYSVNDTVIIFDRIRENAERLKDKKFPRIINISINETLSRTCLTSLTTFMTTLMMSIFGTGLVRNFGIAMNVGIIVGTYSSIFIASPVALYLNNRFYSGNKA